MVLATVCSLWWLRLYFPWSSSLDQSLLPAEKNIIIISTAERCSYKRFSFPSHTHYPTHPSTKNFWAFKPVYTKAFRRCDCKVNIAAVRILFSEKTYGGYWETVVDCMENIEKRQQWLILPKNCLRTQLWFNQNIRRSIKKVPMTGPSRGSLWYLQRITTMDNNG